MDFMSSVQKAVFPGTFLGILFLILFTNALTGSRGWVMPNPALRALKPAPVLQSGLGSSGPSAADSAPAAAAAPAAPEVSGCAISPSFPQSIQQWCDKISEYAAKNNLDPNLIASVMLQESGGNPNAYSKSGAVGLMQVMPKDGLAAKFQCINGPCFASRPSSDELYDPDFNIAYGTRMLRGLVDRNGSVRDALKSYGPMDMGYRYADIVLAILNRYSQ
jgi:soluble lytic murein transglycosylase-like protein